MMIRQRSAISAIALVLSYGTAAAACTTPPITSLKSQSVTEVEAWAKLAQEINGCLFSFSEPALQEYKTAKYLTDILEKEGFVIKRSVAGLSTGWVEHWTSASGGRHRYLRIQTSL